MKFGTEAYRGLTPDNLKSEPTFVSYRGLTPDNLKSEPTLELFKKKIRKWRCESCPCRMCKTYLQHVGFQLIKTLASNGSFLSVLSRSKTFCWGRWELILISYLYYVQFNRLERMRINK